MADGFVQAGLVRPKPPVANKHRDGRKRKGDSSPPFYARSRQPFNVGWHNTSSSRTKQQHDQAPRAPKPSAVPKPSIGYKNQPKGKPKSGKGRGGQNPKTT